MTVALVFPGQGSQSVGMLRDLMSHHPDTVGRTFEEASGVLGYDLWQIVSNGPAEALNATERTQPAMLAAGIATWRCWLQEGGARPALVSGHSLGEFSALVCAGALDFTAAIDLVRFRGQAMQEAVPRESGAMAAVLGLDDADVEAACREAAEGAVVEAVNFNSPGQVVIAGETRAVERAIGVAKARGAKRAVMLPVSVPAHSSLMRVAAQRLRERLGEIKLERPSLRYVSAVDAAEHSDPADIVEILVRQLASPVRWSATVLALTSLGATRLLECGPGKVLTALNRRIERRAEISCMALEDAFSLAAAAKEG